MTTYYNERALPLNEWKGDSFRIRIAPDKWALTQKAIELNAFGYGEEVARTNMATGETITEEQWVHSNLRRWKEDETKSSVKYEVLKGNLFSIEEGTLQIHINSKVLKGLYLQGINPTTIALIYRNIIEEGFIELSFNDFLESEWMDLDLTMDVLVSNPPELVRTSKKLTKPSQQPYCHTTLQQGNVGVQWGTRKGSSGRNKKSVFLKFYSKPLELQSPDTYPFYTKHLLPTLSAGAEELFDESPIIALPEGLMRVEFNLYRPSAFKLFGFKEPKTLRELLLFLADQDKVQSLFIKVRDDKMKPRQIIKDPDELTPSQIPIEFTLETLVRENGFKGTGKHQRAANYFLDSCFPSPVRKDQKSKKRNLSRTLDKVALILDKREDSGKQLSIEVYEEAKSLKILP